MSFYLKAAFNLALGMRSVKAMREPLHRAISLDAPIGGEADDWTLFDVFADPLSEDAFRAVDEEDYRRKLNVFLRESIMRVCTGRGRELLLAMLDFNTSVAEAARIVGMNPKSAYGSKSRAIRKVSAYLRGMRKKFEAEFDIGRYRGVSVAAWRNRGFTSVTEAEAMYRAEIDLWRE